MTVLSEAGRVEDHGRQVRPRRRPRLLLFGISCAAVALAGFLIPEKLVVPVQGASAADWNEDTFWYEPWGASGVHKGIDIFAPVGTPVLAATPGVVVFAGTMDVGGNIVAVLGPKWRLHYYAHLDAIDASGLSFLAAGEVIGSVGNSGNAAGKPSHLHYTILSVFPYVWRLDTETQGWKKMFYLNPDARLRSIGPSG